MGGKDGWCGDDWTWTTIKKSKKKKKCVSKLGAGPMSASFFNQGKLVVRIEPGLLNIFN